MVSRGVGRFLAWTLILQQVLGVAPAQAAINVQAGKPLDSAAIDSANAEGRRSPTITPNLFTGDATMQVPIVVPPGTGGLTPGVALSYSSGRTQHDGPVGIGWTLDIGPSVIQRSLRDGAPEYDSSDEFELDGRLLKATGTSGRYVTEGFDHSRIEHITAGGDYWRILRPDGVRLYFGYHNAPTANPPNESVNFSTEVKAWEGTPPVCGSDPFSLCFEREVIIAAGIPFAWHLDRVEDRNGNVVRLRWESLGDEGARYLVEASWSEHVGGAVTAVPSFGGADDGTLTRTRRAQFLYDTQRLDTLPTYRAGFRRQWNHRLNEIRVEVDGSLSRHYKLFYEQSPASGRSRLTRVEDHGNVETAIYPFVHTFTYGNGGTPGWSAKDGTFALPNGLTFVLNNKDRGLRLIDVNGDAYPDVVRGLAGTTQQAYLGGPNGFATSSTTAWKPPVDFAQSGPGYTGAEFGDFNGDGRPDIIRRSLAVSGINRTNGPCGTSRQNEVGPLTGDTWLNTGSGWSATTASQDPNPIPFTTSVFSYSGSANSCPNENLNLMSSLNGISVNFDQATRIVDVNGDGRDDAIWKRSLAGVHTESQQYWEQFELRLGTLVNGASGLAFGTFNNAHAGYSYGLNYGANPDQLISEVEFAKPYTLPRWQIPFSGPTDVYWSSFGSCDTSDNKTVDGHSGKERVLDLNGDGLPDILESVRRRSVDCSNYPPCIIDFPEDQLGSWVNNGYGWQLSEETPSHPEFGIWPPHLFYSVTESWTEVTVSGSQSQCTVLYPGDGEDYGRRYIDVNGDGGPDVLGHGLGTDAVMWNATVPEWGGVPGNPRYLWILDPAWATPVSFSAANGQDTGARLVDVNADGMVDILVSDGAYLNLGEPPDRLETAANPYGAVTTLRYAPSTDYETLPVSNPTVDGQRNHGQPVWVLDQLEVDPGAAFGQPTMVHDFEYYGGTYDEGDRAFRGFKTAISLGPTTGSAERAITTTSFYTRDELQGLPYEVEVARAPAANPSNQTVLYRTTTEYAAAPGSATTATVYYPDGTTAGLSSVDSLTQAQAFTPFKNLLSGSPQAAEAFLAVPIASEVIVTEGTANAAVSRTEASFDFYGNAIERRELGDPADATDDVTTVVDFAIRDELVGGQQVLLASRPSRVERTGVLGSLPAGTVVERVHEILYDGQSTIGDDIVRGNATAVRQYWATGPTTPTWVRVDQSFDVYGNVATRSFPYDEAGPASGTSLVTTWDTASRTFPVSFATSVSGEPGLSYQVTLEYEGFFCVGPKGMGLVCTRTSPNSATVLTTYDAFGRELITTGPVGWYTWVNYHDPDRGTASQRTSVRMRWDENAPQPQSDSDAIIEHTYFDGLGRTLQLTKRGRSSDVASATISYDSAGNASQATRWAYSGTGPATTYEHDVLGRLTRRTQPELAYTDLIYTVVDSGSPALAQRQVQVERYDGALVQKRAERTDALGRLAAVDEYPNLGGSANTTTYDYDPFDQLVRVSDAIANNPALCSGLDPNCATQRHETLVFYDELGSRVRLDDPDTGTWLTKRDARGLAVETTDPRANVYSLEYDPLARLERRHLVDPPNMSVLDHVFTYAASDHSVLEERGRLIQIDDQEGHETFSYDLAGNMSFHQRVVGGRRFDFTHTYDPLGRRIHTLYPDGDEANWVYDKRLLARISQASGNDHVSDLQYDALDRVTALGLGGSTGSPVVSESRTYDPTSGRLDVIDATAGATTLANFDYEIDGLGRIETILHSSRSVAGSLVTRNYGFEYDGLDRLLSATGPYASGESIVTLTYAHDALGNLRKKDDGGTGWPTLEYNDPDRPHAFTRALDSLGASQREYDYDAGGNVTQARALVGGAWNATTLAYDPLGNLTTLGNTTMGYDASSRRVRLSQGSPTVYFPEPDFEYLVSSSLNRSNKHFFVDGRRVASAYKSWTAPSASAPIAWTWRGPDLPDVPPWAWGLLYTSALAGLAGLAWRRRREGTFSPALRGTTLAVLAMTAPALIAGTQPPANQMGTHAESQLFYVTDHLGSTVVSVKTDGTVRNRYTYEPFGDAVIQEGADLHHRFTGGYRDPTGAYSLGFRHYDPDLGRFVQPDPIVGDVADPQTFNRYSYALGNPVRWIDPSGLFISGGSSEGGSSWDIGIVIGPPSPSLPGPPRLPDLPNQVGNVPKGAGARPIGANVAEGEWDHLPIPGGWGGGQIPGGLAGEILYTIFVEDIVANVQIIFNPEAPTGSKIIAIIDIVTEVVPQKKIFKAIDKADDVYDAIKKARTRAKKTSTLEPGPYARESIPGHRGPLSAAEQRRINEINARRGCHTCGSTDPGTKSGNAIGDHQPPQALGEPTDIYPHCIDCMRRQGGEVLQELLRTNKR